MGLQVIQSSTADYFQSYILFLSLSPQYELFVSVEFPQSSQPFLSVSVVLFIWLWNTEPVCRKQWIKWQENKDRDVIMPMWMARIKTPLKLDAWGPVILLLEKKGIKTPTYTSLLSMCLPSFIKYGLLSTSQAIFRHRDPSRVSSQLWLVPGFQATY